MSFVLVGGVLTTVVLNRNRPQVLTQASSPDGTWSVVIAARPVLIGAGEIVAEIRGVDGEAVSVFVIGFDSKQERSGFADSISITFDSNKVARIGEDLYVLRKSTYFRAP